MRYIQNAVVDASAECEHHFAESDAKYAAMSNMSFAPNVVCIDKRKEKGQRGFVYIAQHLHHLVFELLKNSMRAVLEKNAESEMNPITVVVVDNPSR